MKASFPYWLLCFISLSMSLYLWCDFSSFSSCDPWQYWLSFDFIFYELHFFMYFTSWSQFHTQHGRPPGGNGTFPCSQKLLNSSVWSWHLWPISLWSYFLVVSRQDSGTTDRAGCGHACLGKSCVGWKMGGTFLNASGSHEPSDMGPGSQI